MVAQSSNTKIQLTPVISDSDNSIYKLFKLYLHNVKYVLSIYFNILISRYLKLKNALFGFEITKIDLNEALTTLRRIIIALISILTVCFCSVKDRVKS